MMSSVEPSLGHGRRSRTAISATVWRGTSNSASDRPAHIRSAIAFEPGPGILSSISWRSPMKVSDCQSIDRTSVSKILFLGTAARAKIPRRRADAAADVAILITAPPPDRHAPWRPSPVGDRGHCEDRTQTADLPLQFGRSGWEGLQFGAKIFLPL